MKVKTLARAERELRTFPFEIQKKFLNYFRDYENGEMLHAREFKKLKGYDLYEFRVKGEGGIFRALAGMIRPNMIVVVFFHKKTQKTPKKEIKTAERRINTILF